MYVTTYSVLFNCIVSSKIDLYYVFNKHVCVNKYEKKSHVKLKIAGREKSQMKQF